MCFSLQNHLLENYQRLFPLKELIVKTIFFTSTEEENLENFINEFLSVCSKYKLKFNEISTLFEKMISITIEDEQ